MALGSFCLVLHGHLPWVAHHGRWPHGEDWLFEAAAETWLPLLAVLDTAKSEGLRIQWTLGLMPILLEQLATPTFQRGFVRYLQVHGIRRKRTKTTSTPGVTGNCHGWLSSKRNITRRCWTSLRRLTVT